MREEGRYSECVLHRHGEITPFFESYFKGKDVLLIGGAGFDPRACSAAQELQRGGARLEVNLIREQRSEPINSLTALAEQNLALFRELTPSLQVTDVEIFGNDGAIVGGRRAARTVSDLNISSYSDVIVDISALSIGTSFPIVRLLVEQFSYNGRPRNLHVTVAHDPGIDARITRTAGDRPGWVHGFGGSLGIDRDQNPARLWMPQLASGAQQEARRIYDFVHPDDTCPILPFPARDPRLADDLALEYREELLNTWAVDVRNIVYADEDDPLDVYRTILRIDDLRKPVFEGSGGSATIVSPTSSKLTALGALMASTERDLPVAYLEAENYDLEAPSTSPPITSQIAATPGLVHLWLEGEAYAGTRPALRREV